MGQTIDQSDATSLALTFDVAGVDPAGVATINVTVDEAQLGEMGGMMEMLGAGKDNPLGDALELAGRTFTMTVTSTGHVEKVEGMTPMVDDATKKAKELLTKELAKAQMPPQQKAMMQQLTGAIGAILRRVFGDYAMAETMEDMMARYPKAPVKVGDSWTSVVFRSYGMSPMIRTETWTLTERKDGVLSLALTSKIEPNPDAPSINIGVGTMRLELSGQETGTIEMHEATGWIRKANLTQQIDGTNTLTMSSGPAIGPQTISVKASVTKTIESSPKGG